MAYQKEIEFFAKNLKTIEMLAEKQGELMETSGKDVCEFGFLCFDYENKRISNPFYSECERFEVNPVIHYGESFLASDFCNEKKVKEALLELGLRIIPPRKDDAETLEVDVEVETAEQVIEDMSQEKIDELDSLTMDFLEEVAYKIFGIDKTLEDIEKEAAFELRKHIVWSLIMIGWIMQ